LDNNPHITYKVDVHSHAEKVSYPWGIDRNQSTDRSMNFQNPSFDGKRENSINDEYFEFMVAISSQNDLDS
jgi:murein tripeptide amidase MpaA